MVPEQRVFDLASLIDKSWSRSFVTAYLGWSYARTDAPLVYGLNGAVTLLAINAHPGIFAIVGARIHAISWGLAIGSSGWSRKTTTLDLIEELQSMIDATKIAPEPASVEALEKGIFENPQQAILYGEFGDFLSQSSAAGYFRPMRERYTKLYDCRPLRRSFSKKETIVIDNPRLSLIGGVTPSYLEAFTSETDWEGGFMGRFACWVGKPERYEPWPQQRQDLQDWCGGRLLEVAQTPGTFCEGLDPEAYKLFDAWSRGFRKTCLESSEGWVSAAGARTQAMVVRYSLLLSLDAGVDVSRPWKVPAMVVNVAIKMAELNFDSLFWIIRDLCGSDYARERRSVVRVLEPRRIATLSQILKGTNPPLQKRDALRVLESLEAEELVFRRQFKGTDAWALDASLGDPLPVI